jgi:TRAF-interacting protein
MNVNCSTCLELLTPSADLSSAPCGHIFHSLCIIQWFETGKSSCPQCRARCFEKQLRRVFFTEAANVTLDSQSNVNTLQDRLDSLTFKLRCSENELKVANESKNKAVAQAVGLREEFRDTEVKLIKIKEEIATKVAECRILRQENKKIEQAKKKAKELEEKVEMYKHIDFVINETSSAVKQKLHENGDYSKSSHDSAIIIGKHSVFCTFVQI